MPTRRLVLTAALATGAMGACTTGSPGTPTTDDDPDATLVVEALAAETALLAVLDALTEGRPRRARTLAATRSVHLAHTELLREAAGSPPSTTPSPGPPSTGDDRAAYLALARAEERLGQTLRRAAFRAESGPFARVLAGMAGAAAQQSASLRTLA